MTQSTYSTQRNISVRRKKIEIARLPEYSTHNLIIQCFKRQKL